MRRVVNVFVCRFQIFNTRHNDPTTPTARFNKGKSAEDFPKALERLPLLIQLQVCLGNKDTFLPAETLKKLQELLHALIRLRFKVDMFPMPQDELNTLQDGIISCCDAMKAMFKGGASEFQFIKFHMISHVPWQIKRFGIKNRI